jgi:CRP-like cAMP-binding protein
VRENDTGTHFFLLAAGSAKVMRRERLLNLINEGEFFGEMAYILGRHQRHATVVATNDLLLAEFKPEALARISLGAQLQLTRGLARNLVERLALANTRLTG